MLAVTTPAADPKLLSAEEMRVAVGLASDDVSKDTALAALNGRVSRTIAAHCRIVSAGVAVPTLRQETLTETFRTGMCRDRLIVSRRPIVSVTSVVEDGETLAGANYEINTSAGILTRLDNDEPVNWSWAKTVVVYVAGWDVVPDDLKFAASKLASEFYSAGSRDTNLKRIKVDGVDEREFFYGSQNDPLISAEIDALLLPYMNIWLG